MAASFQGSSSWLPLAQGQTALLGGGAHSSGRPLQAQAKSPAWDWVTRSRATVPSSNVRSRLVGPDDCVSHPRAAAVRRAEAWLAVILQCWRLTQRVAVHVFLDPSGQIRLHFSSPGSPHAVSGASDITRGLVSTGDRKAEAFRARHELSNRTLELISTGGLCTCDVVPVPEYLDGTRGWR